MYRSRSRRDAPAINAGSMADIAFLLLIFFLVTTNILEDKGILVRLPIWENEPPEPEDVNSNNVFTVKINGANEIYAEGKVLGVQKIKEEAKLFITNPLQLPNRPTNPSNAVVSLQHDRGTKYETYLQVYNELKRAYNELWEEKALALYNKSFVDLPIAMQKNIRKEIPLVISEAEPTVFLDSSD